MTPPKRRSHTAKLSDSEKRALRRARLLLVKSGLNKIPQEFGSISEITDGSVVELGCTFIEAFLAGRLILKGGE